MTFDVNKIRKDFPIFTQKIHGHDLVYLDNAASSQKPKVVIDRIKKFYEEEYSNVHRGIHTLSQKSTHAYELAREQIHRFINAKSIKEIVFVKGTTDAINLVASSFGKKYISKDDEILITAMEHHSNIVPWQILCESTGAHLKVAPMNHQGELLLDQLESMLTPQTKLLSVVHLSNALGTINPIKKIIKLAHQKNIPVLVDGAQSATHLPIDVQDLDCDFFAFSGHKLYGPTGIGVLYGRADLLNNLPPYQGGGDMIQSVSFEKTTYNIIPYKFEAGTPNIAGAVGLGEALEYLKSIDWPAALQYEHELFEYTQKELSKIKQVQMIGTAPQRTGLVSFMINGVHPHDVGTILDRQGIAIRAGHHCAQPIMDFFKVPATIRASFSFYNTKGDIDRLIGGIHKVLEVFK